jgi:hypothetical protein
MKKQRISLLLMLLANLLLLADVVLPHHHHESSICFSIFGNHSTTDEHHHQSPVDNSNSNDCSGCALKNTDILLNNVERNHFKQLEINAFDFVCQAAVNLLEPSLYITGHFKTTSSPPVRLIDISGIQGLRAPPVA